MKVTLDHNCIIHLVNRTEIGEKMGAIVHDERNQCFVVNIGASEMLERGVRPNRYDKFEELLETASIAHLPRLDPLLIWDLTFWDKCVWDSDETRKLATEIEAALFGNSQRVDIAALGLESPLARKWVNQMCDVQTMWCHIQNGNDVFLTTDGNFSKESKMPRLLALGAGRIAHPSEL
jgi:hypothetical protein